MKIGLVLEGGAMRGMYTAGILDVFLDKGIHVDGVIGVSAGALFGVNYLSGQRGRVIRYNKKYNKESKYIGLLPLLREGNVVNTKYAYNDVPRYLDPFDDEAFRASNVPFYAVVTNLKTGNAEYVQIKSVFEQMDTLRASGSMPFLSKPVEINGKKYLDGAVSDSIPFQWMQEQGYDKLIVILTRDAGYRKKAMSKRAVKLVYHRYPKFANKLITRHEMYGEQIQKLNQWSKDGRAFVIRPSQPIKIGRIEKDPIELQRVYEQGVADAGACMVQLEEYW